jgi:hypothetical protein
MKRKGFPEVNFNDRLSAFGNRPVSKALVQAPDKQLDFKGNGRSVARSMTDPRPRANRQIQI